MKKVNDRLITTLNEMSKLNLDFLIISSKENIRFLFGDNLETGKRSSMVIVGSNGDVNLIINEIFSDLIIHMSNTKIQYYRDGENPIDNVLQLLSANSRVGIEKTLNVEVCIELKESGKDIKLVLSECIERIREIKDENELSILRHSSRIADAVMHQVVQLQEFPTTEESLERIVKSFFREYNISDLTFNPIIASASNTANPHHIPGDKFTELNKPLLIDLGGKYKGYCSDITRMFYFSEVDDRFLEHYEYLREAQSAVLEMLKPGLEMREIDYFIRGFLKKKNLEESFIHGIGHGIGLEAHEFPYIHSQNKEILKEGMVITVGPGIYVRDEFGMRIEDIICITENGHENFNNLSKELVLL